MPALACGTIVAKSYLPFARVLSDSFRRYHPDIPFFVLLADEVDGYFDPSRELFDVLRLSDLDIPRLEHFRFHYAQQPLSYASTPYLLGHLLKQGFSRVVFFKQESLVLGDLASLFDSLEKASIVLTPHLLAPLTGADRITRELNIHQSGTFNVGILGVADTPVTARFLTWWQDRVYAHCRHAVADGMHYEQRWLDLAPAFFDDVHVVRDAGCNVAYWNLPERDAQMGVSGAFQIAPRADSFTSAASSRNGPGRSLDTRTVSAWRPSGRRPLSSSVTSVCSKRMAIRPAGTGRTHSAVSTTACRSRKSHAGCIRTWATPRTRSAIHSRPPGGAAIFTGSTSRGITPPIHAVQSQGCGRLCIEADPMCSAPFPTSSAPTFALSSSGR